MWLILEIQNSSNTVMNQSSYLRQFTDGIIVSQSKSIELVMGDNISDFDQSIKYVIQIGHFDDLLIILKIQNSSIELLYLYFLLELQLKDMKKVRLNIMDNL